MGGNGWRDGRERGRGSRGRGEEGKGKVKITCKQLSIPTTADDGMRTLTSTPSSRKPCCAQSPS
jgi:hypothetical protein